MNGALEEERREAALRLAIRTALDLGTQRYMERVTEPLEMGPPPGQPDARLDHAHTVAEVIAELLRWSEVHGLDVHVHLARLLAKRR